MGGTFRRCGASSGSAAPPQRVDGLFHAVLALEDWSKSMTLARSLT